MSAARGTYTVEGNTFTRKYVANIDPSLVGGENVTQFTLSGDTLTIRGNVGCRQQFESTFQRLKAPTRDHGEAEAHR